MPTIKYPYKSKSMEINKDNVKNLAVMSNRRFVVQNHVNKIVQLLETGKHFSSPIVVNAIDGKMRIIDGNHRYEAISKWIKADSKRKIEINFATYTDLTSEQEKDVFTVWNSGRKQSRNDYIKLHEDEIKILKKMQRDFPVPVRIYNPVSAQMGVHFTGLMTAYLTAKCMPATNSFSFWSGSPMEFVEECKKLFEEDYKFLVKFVEMFERVFGRMEKDNIYNNTYFLTVLMVLWYDNLSFLGAAELERRLKKRIAGRQHLTQLAMTGNYATMKMLYKQMQTEMNHGKSTHFVMIRCVPDNSQNNVLKKKPVEEETIDDND